LKDIHLGLNILKEELNQRGIDPIRMNLTQEIKQLDKAIQIKKRSDMLRFDALYETCHALNRNSKEIKAKLAEVNEHLYKV
jgi:hypothetical protein